MQNHVFICGNGYILSNKGCYYLLKKTLNSAIKIGLTVHFIFDQYPIINKTKEIERKLCEIMEFGVKIHYRESQLKTLFIKNLSSELARITTGAFLRMEIPNLCKELNIKDIVLYTDFDVLFLQKLDKLFEFDLENNLFACSTEFWTDKLDYIENNIPNFNTGVMLMDVNKIIPTYDSFICFVKENLNLCIKHAFDQGMINIFYKDKIKLLPVEYNWKPYWGQNHNVKILHWHGLKPFEFINISFLGFINRVPDVDLKKYNSWLKTLITYQVFNKKINEQLIEFFVIPFCRFHSLLQYPYVFIKKIYKRNKILKKIRQRHKNILPS